MENNNTSKGIGFLAALSLLVTVAIKKCHSEEKIVYKIIENLPNNSKVSTVEPIIELPIPPIKPTSPFKRIPNIEPINTKDPIILEQVLIKQTFSPNELLSLNVFEGLSNVKDKSSLSKELDDKINSKYFELKEIVPEHGILGSRDKVFYDELYNAYKIIKEKLNTEFSDDDFIYLNFLKESYNKFEGYTNNLSYTKGGAFTVQIIPKYLIEPNNKINLNTYFLYTGSKITAAQQKIITEIYSYGFTNTKRELENCFVVEMEGDEYVFRTLVNEYKRKALKPSLKKITGLTSKNILIKGNISQDLIEFLRDSKVRIVADAMKYFDIINLEKQKIKYYVIIPEQDEELLKMYGINQEQVKDLRLLLTDFAATPNTEILRTKYDCENKFRNAPFNSETPILIFNNTNGKLFDKPFRDYPILENVITCNSLSLENADLTFNSTDYLYIKQTFNALRKTNINEEMRLDEFYFTFAKNYNYEMVKTNNKKVFNIVLLSVGGTSVFTGAIYLGNQKK